MTKPLFLSLFAFAVACGTADKEDTSSTEPTSEPASQPASAPTSSPSTEVLLYVTQEWSGEWTITETDLTGKEYYLENIAEAPGDYACNSVWDMAGTPATACTDCVWEMALTATFNEGESTLNGDCDTSDYNFSYAYTTDYQYNGESMGEALLYAGDSGEFGAFVFPGYPNLPAVDTYKSEINWDAATGVFSYTQGPKDYEYLYTY